MQWIKRMDHSLLLWCNQRLSRPSLDWLFGWLTHLGGASFTILFAVFLIGFAKGEFSEAGLESLIALTISHIITVIIKKNVRRARPYRKMNHVRVGKFPLKDYSFPSGHTTAIFALLTPLMLASTPAVSMILTGLAILVAVSRVYWGYHYPLDCLVGGMIGYMTAIFITL
ncbi:phosphatase PAP2 family protein [Paenibacillus mendelii]|uniref:Phosphatase PAP2 family protein n=1 Tax=Paenibacillus mendelii TaxID=206163 RepID=A0ABV6J5B3_9BACL|nr:phosphatase PAP2 family protein [Paenibacillus mendelii]MCQ6560222.1 phosphatase PAP2 family protein [Paenibacillus mendelii]